MTTDAPRKRTPPPPNLDPAKLRRARVAAGLLQADVAAIVGVDQPSISDYERGVCDCLPDRLAKLAGAIGVPAEQLMPDAA